ncbi:MAG: helix-turn-helix transcriptional regulator [Patescibacteria group bacterium]|jgi:DNA-binding PadR family transcriptional regulator
MNDYSGLEILILEILQENGNEMYGLDIIERSSGKLKRGTVYVWLDQLEDRNDIASRREEHVSLRRPRRRLYRITDQGLRVLIDQALSA